MPLLTNQDTNKVVCVLSLLKHIPIYTDEVEITFEDSCIQVRQLGERHIQDIIEDNNLFVDYAVYNEMTRKYTELSLYKMVPIFKLMKNILYQYGNYIELDNEVLLVDYGRVMKGGELFCEKYDGRLILNLIHMN